MYKGQRKFVAQAQLSAQRADLRREFPGFPSHAQGFFLMADAEVSFVRRRRDPKAGGTLRDGHGVPSHDFNLQQQPAQILDFYKPVSQDLSKLKVRLGTWHWALGEQKHNVRSSFHFFFQVPKKVPMVSNTSFDKDTFLQFDQL